MGYLDASEWNEANEIRCLIIYKKLEVEGFPRGRQAELCREMAAVTKLDYASISAKVSNFKSVAGVVGPSNASSNTREVFEKYGQMSVPELMALIA